MPRCQALRLMGSNDGLKRIEVGDRCAEDRDVIPFADPHGKIRNLCWVHRHAVHGPAKEKLRFAENEP